MPLDPERVRAQPPKRSTQAYKVKDTILYALGVGAGAVASEDARALRFVYEDGIKALPTMAVVLATPGFWARDPAYGLNWRRLLHATQSLEMHRPLAPDGEIQSVMTIDALYDRADKGALIQARRELTDAAGEKVATLVSGLLFRADGGFGGEAAPAVARVSAPERAPDVRYCVPTRPEQAMIYRLSGDDNPLHIDPSVAKTAGFERPILHGLATFGAAGLGLAATLCECAPERLRKLQVQFTSPAYPGDTLALEAWRTGEREAYFRVLAVERGVVVLDRGVAIIE